MKKKIHPKYVEATVICGCGETFKTRSTKEKIVVEICSKCHPFYTGKEKLIDTAGMVEKFERRYGWSKSREAAMPANLPQPAEVPSTGAAVQPAPADVSLPAASATAATAPALATPVPPLAEPAAAPTASAPTTAKPVSTPSSSPPAADSVSGLTPLQVPVSPTANPPASAPAASHDTPPASGS